MAKRRFQDGVDELIGRTPEHLVGHLVVDQIYAHYQHAHPEFHHPDGGQAFYLSEPLFFKAKDYLRRLAKGAVNGGLTKAMIENMEDLSHEVFERAPFEFGALKGSGHPIVEADGAEVYNRPPAVHRLSAEELKWQEHLRYLFDPHRYDYDRRH